MTAKASGRSLEVGPPAEEASSGLQIMSLQSLSDSAKDERVPAFTIDGNAYTIRTAAKVNESLRYINLARTRGPRIAIDYMMDALLGREGWQAFIGFEDLTEADFAQLADMAVKIMNGPTETPKGTQKSASIRSRG